MQKNLQMSRPVNLRRFDNGIRHTAEEAVHNKDRKGRKYRRKDYGKRVVQKPHSVKHQIFREHQHLERHHHQNNINRKENLFPRKTVFCKSPGRRNPYKKLPCENRQRHFYRIPEHHKRFRRIKQQPHPLPERRICRKQRPPDKACSPRQHRGQVRFQLISSHQRACQQEQDWITRGKSRKRQKSDDQKLSYRKSFFHRYPSIPSQPAPSPDSHTRLRSRISMKIAIPFITAAAAILSKSKSKNQLLNKCCIRYMLS